MDFFEKNFTDAIIDKLKSKLDRDLTPKEVSFFKLKGLELHMI